MVASPTCIPAHNLVALILTSHTHTLYDPAVDPGPQICQRYRHLPPRAQRRALGSPAPPGVEGDLQPRTVRHSRRAGGSQVDRAAVLDRLFALRRRSGVLPGAGAARQADAAPAP